MSDLEKGKSNRQLGDLRRTTKLNNYFPDLRQNFSVRTVGCSRRTVDDHISRSGGVSRNVKGLHGSTALEYSFSQYLTSWWQMRLVDKNPAALNMLPPAVATPYNGTKVGTVGLQYGSDNPFNVVDGPITRRPQSVVINDAGALAIAESNIGHANFTPSASFLLGFCLQAWVKREAGSSDDDTILCMGQEDAGGSTNDRQLYRLYVDNSTDQLVFRLYEGAVAEASDYVETRMDKKFTDIDVTGTDHGCLDNKWVHIFVWCTGTTLAAGQPMDTHIYINGRRMAATKTNASFGGMAGSYNLPELTIGGQKQVNGSYVATSYTKRFKGEIAEVAFWKDVPYPYQSGAVIANVASALYAARNGYYRNRSGIISPPVRLELKRRDCRTGSYPTNLRTPAGSKLTKGNYNTFFDDRKTVVFSNEKGLGLFLTGAHGVSYPQVLQSGSRDNFLYPSSSIGTITRTVVKGVSDNHIEFTPGIESGPFDDTRAVSLPPITRVDSAGSSVIETIPLSSSSYYLTGTSRDVMEGFTSRLSSKTMIHLDITPTETLELSRTPIKRYSILDTVSAGRASKTGFAYWNNSLKRWEQIGFSDPVTGADIKYDFAAVGMNSEAQPTHDIVSGTNSYPSQFAPCRHKMFSAAQVIESGSSPPDWSTAPGNTFTYGTNTGLLAPFFYHKIGSPTIASFAPNKTIYHATSSQAIKMSSFIQHPFLLEKVVVNLNVTAQRQYAGNIDGTTAKGTHTRHQDDYVFFIYRQERRNRSGSFRGGKWSTTPATNPSENFRVDSAFDVSGSQRFLVCSGVMTFYEEKVFTSGSAGTTEGYYAYRPINTPAFMHNMGIKGGSRIISKFTGSVNMNLIPAVASEGFNGVSAVFNSASPKDATASRRVPKIYHYWPGGTTHKAFFDGGKRGPGIAYDPARPSIYTGKAGVTASYGKWTFSQFCNGAGITTDPNTGIEYQPDSNSARRQLGSEIYELDPRVIRPFGDKKTVQTEFADHFDATDGRARIIDYSQSAISPYLLFPEDEIILGLDAAISPGFNTMITGSGNAGLNPRGGQCHFSGSHLRIISPDDFSDTPETAPEWESPLSNHTITLYGSLIRDQVEFHGGLNQHLTSDAIHEALQEEIVDQYDISSEHANAGNYSDNLVTGSMLSSDYPHGAGAEAVARITIPTSPMGAIGNTITIISTDGTSKAYVGAASQDLTTNPPKYDFNGTTVEIADSLKACIEHSNGHNGKIDVVKLATNPPILKLAQDVKGLLGNRTISTNISTNPPTISGFSGGTSGESSRLDQARGVAGSFVRGTADPRGGSFQRSVTLYDDSERFYDTLMPDLWTYASRTNAAKLQSTGSKNTIVFDPPYYYQERGNDRMPWPYSGNPVRNIDENTALAIFGESLFFGRGTFYAHNSTIIKMILFEVGYGSGVRQSSRTPGMIDFTWWSTNKKGKLYNQINNVLTYTHAHPNSTGSRGFRYGIKNIHPENSKACFRRDRYGQFRDMLEQRRNSVFYKPPGSDKNTNSSDGGTNLTDPAVSCMFTVPASSMAVDPYYTTCRNLSNAATSSVPYIEGEGSGVEKPSLTMVLVTPATTAGSPVIVSSGRSMTFAGTVSAGSGGSSGGTATAPIRTASGFHVTPTTTFTVGPSSAYGGGSSMTMSPMLSSGWAGFALVGP